MIGLSVPTALQKPVKTSRFEKSSNRLLSASLPTPEKKDGRSRYLTLVVGGIVKANIKQQKKTSDFEHDLAARLSRFARFMRYCSAIERKCQANSRSELSISSQLA
jgi:hypothetical protein